MKKIAITVKPTNDCNMRCKHCYHAEEGFASEQMLPEYAQKIIDIAVKEFDEIKIVFHGGEPTLWGKYNIQSVLDYERKIKYKNPHIKFENSIQTNGLLIDDEWISLFKDYGVTVGVSYDGPHNYILRSHSDEVYKNIQKLKESGIYFGILCVESNKSINNFSETYEWFKREHINFKVLALFMSGEAIHHKDLELDIDVYVDKLTETYKKWLHDKECTIQMITFEDLLKVADKLYCLQYGGSCIYNRIALNPNGNLYPCGRPYTDDFILGNINTIGSIAEAFQTAPYQRLVSISEERTRQCQKKCKYFGVCRGGCVSSAILEGSFEKIDNTSCIRARKLLSRISEINSDIYSKFDKKEDLELLNPKAIEIMTNVRLGKYEFTHFKR